MTARLGGRVALVTGAGRGLGRAHAHALARDGALVVVNDLGTALDGSGTDSGPAEAVANEITATGGRAVADTTDVASIQGGVAAVLVALDAYGRIDIVVNNAGFAHGGGEVEHPIDAELDALFGVHYKAALGTISAAFGPMRAQGFGRIINTVSEVALDARLAEGIGYGPAKAALWSLTLAASRQAAPHGITVNAISPGARTRMNAELLDAGFRDRSSGALDLDPEHVARVVAYLAGDDAGDITGRIVHAAGGQLREYITRRSAGSELVHRLEQALQP